MDDGKVLNKLSCDSAVMDLWGSADSGVLVAGQSNGKVALFCLVSGHRILDLDCEGAVRSVWGCGVLSDSTSARGMTIVAGTVMSGVKVWNITNVALQSNQLEKSNQLQKNLRSMRTLMNDGCGAPHHTQRFFELERKYKKDELAALNGDQLVAELRHSLMSIKQDQTSYNDVNCVWISGKGDILAFSGGESVVSVYRLDTLELSGPTTKMLRKAGGRGMHLCYDLLRYHHCLGPILNDGSLVEWLISTGHDKELELLLHLRPCAALLLLTQDPDRPAFPRKTPFQLAIRLRRDKMLKCLLQAASRYARYREPTLDQLAPPGRRQLTQLLPPAMRHVTGCLRDVLKSEDSMMVEVMFDYLASLEPVDLQVPEHELPRTLGERFRGSPSPSLSQSLSTCSNSLLWSSCEGSVRSEVAGFPACAFVVMLPGLSNYSVLELLSQQRSIFFSSPPIRGLIDAIKANGVLSEFYMQMIYFFVLLLSFMFMVFNLVMDARFDIDTFSLERIAANPRVVSGLAGGLISFVLALKFLADEANELIEEPYGEEVHNCSEEVLLLQDTPSINAQDDPMVKFSSKSPIKSPFQMSERSFKMRQSLRTSVMKQSKRASRVYLKSQTTSHKPSPHKSTNVRKEQNGQKQQKQQPEHNTNAVLKSHQPTPAFEPTPLADTHGEPEMPENGNILTRRTPFYRSFAGAGSAKVSNFSGNDHQSSFRSKSARAGLESTGRGSSKLALIENKVSKFLSTMKSVLRAKKIDVAYFASGWNWLGLSSFILIVACCICYCTMWYHCSSLAKECSVPGSVKSSDLILTWKNPAPSICIELQTVCDGRIKTTRITACFAVVLTFIYALYYLRGIDAYAFLVRMMIEIFRDMWIFFLLSCWILVAIAIGFMCLDCGIHAHDDIWAAPARDSRQYGQFVWIKAGELLQTIGTLVVVVFDPNRDSFSECFESGEADDVTRVIATVLFYVQILICPLVALNALIAIMGSTYTRVSKEHEQQQYKEWASIIFDIVRKWSNAQRIEFERNCYWQHILRRHSDRQAPPVTPPSTTGAAEVHQHEAMGGHSAGASGAAIIGGGIHRSSTDKSKHHQVPSGESNASAVLEDMRKILKESVKRHTHKAVPENSFEQHTLVRMDHLEYHLMSLSEVIEQLPALIKADASAGLGQNDDASATQMD